MPVVNIPNFENLPLTRSMMDPGTYTVQIEDPVGDLQFENDKEYFEVQYTVKQGNNQKQADEEGNHSPVGKKIRDRVYLTGKAAFRLRQLMVCAGLIARDDKASDMARGVNINLDMLMGTGAFQIRLTPNIREVNGQKREYRNVEFVV